MSSKEKQLVAVVGATGLQGAGVVRALQTSGQFTVRALTRDPQKHPNIADEVVEADLNRPETLETAFEGAHGVFLVTNFREAGLDEFKQATVAVRAAAESGVKHLIWSTLPNVEEISGGKLHVPHFTGKARVDAVIRDAGFANHTFVIAPGYYQNFVSMMAPHKQLDGSIGWALPIDPNVRCMHMGDIGELGDIVAGAFAYPELAGNGQYLPLVGDFMSFWDMIDALNKQGHNYSFKHIPKDAFAGAFPGAPEIGEMLGYFQAHTYLGSDMSKETKLANEIARKQPTKLATWAQSNFPVLVA
jgi:hypothetical protein